MLINILKKEKTNIPENKSHVIGLSQQNMKKVKNIHFVSWVSSDIFSMWLLIGRNE